MLVIERDGKEQLREAFKVARSLGMSDQLKQRLRYLDTYAEHDDRGRTQCRLFEDFAPHSFYFVMKRRQEDGSYKRWFNGGLIFHGAHDNGGDGGAPTFSVSLVPATGWQIHS